MGDVGLLVGVGASALAGSFVAVGADARPTRGSVRPEKARPLAIMLERTRLATRLRVREREASLHREALARMPGFLDIVTLGLSAGLSFDSSVELYCTRYHDVLAQAMGEALLSWRIGLRSREAALEDFADELGVGAARRFSATVAEALAFGSPLAEALERQAEVIRDEQRSEMEEEMEKVPVKMLIPLGTLIVPAMLLAILGPLLAPALGRA